MRNQISVVIPVFNSEAFVGEAIESVLNQTYQNIEIIVVDNGSTDGSESVLKRYEKKVKILKEEKRGAAAARNCGIRLAQGDFISFLDSDDLWFPWKLEFQVRYMEQDIEPGLVYSDFMTFNNQGIVERNFAQEKNLPRPSGMIYEDLLYHCLFSTCTVLIRRQTLDDIGVFDERFLVGEDYDLWLRIAKKYRIDFVPGVVTKVRYHSNNITRLSDGGEQPWEIRVLKKAIGDKLHWDEKLKSAPFRKRVARPYFELGYSNFRMGNYERAVSYFRSCARLYPRKIRYLLYYYGSIINPRLMDALFRNVKMVYRIAKAKGRSGTKAKRVNL